HEPCTHYSTLEYVPTRLLDLRNISSGTWRICVPSEDSTGVVAYATISYCWGDIPFLKLTQQLLPDFRAGKPVSQLPQLFQDAMMITKHLGLQYIWIDALCIVQDSEEDWNNEAAEMAEIYSSTVINIIAAACRSPSESLFKARDLRSCHVGRFWPSWNTTDSFFATLHSVDSIMEIESIRRDFENAPTSRRGWILQERVLPSRRLYFFRTQLYYVCRSSEACEIFPDVVPNRLKSYNEIYDLPLPSQQQSPFHNWNFLAEEYSKCSLTSLGDKKIALSGLVKAFRRETGDDYVEGLWKSQLPWTLGWSGSAYSHRRRLALNIAPTWSWLSIDGQINL
ncbi:heterokaryon incompatibility protein-domain-containing protein, partial [Leptodontidium sp. 2 PMI_412]